MTESARITVTSWIAVAVLGLASPARAQPLAISAEIDPIHAGRTARTDAPTLYPSGDGFALADVATFDGALGVVPARPYLASCVSGAIGASTCVRADASVLRRMSLVDGTVLDVEGLDVAWTSWGQPMIAASGDDYLAVLASGELRVWRSGAAPSVTEQVPTPCPLCYVTAITCAARGCSALVSSGWRDDTATLVRVDVGPVPALGASIALGPSYARATLVALDDQWVVAAPDGTVQFFDDALASLGLVSSRANAMGCVHDACLLIDAAGAISRCRSGACAPFGSLPPSLTAASPPDRFVCGTESCGLLTLHASHVGVGGVSGLDGSSVDLGDTYWSRVADELAPHVAVTPAGAFVAYTDARNGAARAALVPLTPGVTSDPIFADFGDDGSDAPTSASALVPGATGTTMLRLDGELPPASTWVRISESGLPIDQRIDRFTCPGLLAAGPNGIEMACNRVDAPTLLVHLSDDGRPTGSDWLLPLRSTMGFAPGDGRSLVIDGAGSAVIVHEPDGAIRPIHLEARHPDGGVVAAGAGRFLVVSSDLGRVVATIVDGDGNLTPILTFPASSVTVEDAHVAFDGSTFLMVWRELSSTDSTTSLQLLRVRADGVAEASARTLASDASSVPFDSLDIAASTVGRSAVVFVRTAPGPTDFEQSTSVHGFEIRSLAPNGTVCADASECGSGICADGLCCSMPCEGACLACNAAAGALADGVCTNRCIDAGPALDAGFARDAGPATSSRGDAGATLRPLGRSCRCGAARASTTWSAWVWLVLALIGRRARRS